MPVGDRWIFVNGEMHINLGDKGAKLAQHLGEFLVDIVAQRVGEVDVIARDAHAGRFAVLQHHDGGAAARGRPGGRDAGRGAFRRCDARAGEQGRAGGKGKHDARVKQGR